MASSPVPGDPQGCPSEGRGLPEAEHGAACPHVCSLPLGAGQRELDKDPAAFRVSPSSGLLEARPVNAPPPFIILEVLFTARYGQTL